MYLSTYAKWLPGLFLLFNLSLVQVQVQAQAQAQTQALETAPVALQTAVRYFYLDGIVEAVNRTTVSAQTHGVIQQVLFDVDDYVDKDTVILSLKNIEQLANVKKAEASIQEARALNLKARQEYDRIKTIFEKKLVAKSTLDEARAQLHASNARLDAVLAGLTQVQEQLSYTRVLAPYSGIVIQRHVEPGEVVQPGMPLMTGISLEHLRVNVDVPQSLINKFRQFGKAAIVLPETSQIVTAQKITIFPFADPSTNTFKARLDLPDGTKQLFPGMYVKVSLVTGEKQQLMVPVRAVVYRSEVTGIYVITEDGRVSFRQIRSGGENGEDSIIVLAGLDEGEQVALDPIAAGATLIKQRTKQRKESQGE